jgi:hypothetical protein
MQEASNRVHPYNVSNRVHLNFFVFVSMDGNWFGNWLTLYLLDWNLNNHFI